MRAADIANVHRNASTVGRNALKKNDSPNGWVVQKFGGTSIGKFPEEISIDIVKASLAYNKVAVVCSALTASKKVSGTTSRLLEIFELLELINLIKDTGSVQYETLVNEYDRLVQVICDDHVNAALQFVQNLDLKAALVLEIQAECMDIIDFRQAAERWHIEIDWRTKDRIVSFGEKLSCPYLTVLLKDKGVDAKYIDLSDIVNLKTSKGLDKEFYRMSAGALKVKLKSIGDKVPVITGYFGSVPGGLVDGAVGRGYTDMCAALIAISTKANELQIWKEVDGIFTADPSRVPTARLLPSITQAEVAELTFYGSEVIHYLIMDQVIHASPPIQIRIKNIKNPEGNGTIVISDSSLSSQNSILRTRLSSAAGTKKASKGPTAVTIKDKISVINVHSNKRSISHGFFANVFSILDRHQVSVDLITTSEVHVSMAIHSVNVSEDSIQNAREELKNCGDVSILHKMAILSLVGAEMKTMVGVAGRMFSILGDHNINLEMISQGASEINISCVIEAHEANRAINILHADLFTFLE